MATKPKPLGLEEAAASGDTAATLTALRDLLARTIVHTGSARELASLSRQFVHVLGELESHKPPTQTRRSPLDELAERRRTTGGTGPRVQPRRTGASADRPNHLP